MQRKQLTMNLDLMTEEEKQICDEAVRIMERLRKEGKITPNPTHNDMVDISGSDEELAILDKAVRILETKT